MSQKKIKNIRLKHYYILIIIFFFIIYLITTPFIKKFNNILKKNYYSRMVEINGYCSMDSYGFLQMIKEKYNLERNPLIINYKVLPNSIWAIYSPSKKFDNRPRIFLNYPKNLDLLLFPSNKFFINKSEIQFSSGIKSISFILKEENIKLNHDISIYKILNHKKVYILKKKINQIINNAEKINLNFKTESINSRWEKVFFEIKNLDENIMSKIIRIELHLKHKYDLSEFEILENYENCYFIR